MERAVNLWDEAGSIGGGPGILRELARLDVRQGKISEARQHLERALERLRKFPEPGTAARVIETRVLKQLDALDAKP